MASASNAKIQAEMGQTPYAMAALTASGAVFTGSAAPWSRRAGFAPEILPDGLVTGGVLSTSTVANTVAIAGGTANVSGVKVSWSATTKTVDVGSSGTAARISSVIVDDEGTVSVVDGTVGAALVDTRNAAGGPPYIPADAIEIGQIRRAVTTATVIASTQIYQVPGIHMEFFNTPAILEVDYRLGAVTFAASFDGIHAAAATKKVYASFATPIFADVPKSSDWQDPAYTYSVASTEYYGGAEGSESKSLGQGQFKAVLEDGVTDPICAAVGQKTWFKFWPDRARSLPYKIALGTLGMSVAYPASGSIVGSFTVSAETPSVGVAV